MSDIKLAASTTDIDLTENALVLVDGTDAIAQHLLIRLRFFLGEYFLNRLLGVPYFEDFFIKSPSLVVIRSHIRETITETPGVIDILRFDMSLDASTRLLSLSFSCSVTTSDEPLDFSEAFLIGKR